MKKLIFIVFFATSLLFPISLLAQETTLPAPVTEENTQPELPIGETPNTDSTKKSEIPEETQQSFLNGILVGAIVGLIAGGIFTWFLKDKII